MDVDEDYKIVNLYIVFANRYGIWDSLVGSMIRSMIVLLYEWVSKFGVRSE